jgi:hypothetical protein
MSVFDEVEDPSESITEALAPEPDLDVPANKILIKGKLEDFALPKSQILRMEIVQLANKNAVRAFAAALGLTVRRVQKVLGVSYDQDLYAFGGEVVDAALEKGLVLSDITDPGYQAWNRILKSMAPVKEAKEVAKN